MTDFRYKLQPLQHQQEVFQISKDMKNFALLMEQGTGKTKVAIDTAAHLFLNKKINCLLVVAPNGVQVNWLLGEIPKHLSEDVPYQGIVLRPSNTSKKYLEQLKTVEKTKVLKIYTINIEAFSSDKAEPLIKQILTSNKCLFVVDESSKIKSPKAARTRTICRLGTFAEYRRIMTGTIATQGPQDVYSQFKFLDDKILGYRNFTAFKNDFINYELVNSNGIRFEKVTGYKDLERLNQLQKPYSYRKLKKEVLDLPEKIYKTVFVELGAEQRRVYNEFIKELVSFVNGDILIANVVLTKFLRGQQILGGYVPLENSEYAFKENPRMEMLLNIFEETSDKVIIWARFRSEIVNIVKNIAEIYGKESVVEYHGGVSSEDKFKNIELFQNDEKVRFIVCSQQAGGTGITLNAASTVVYYSNTYSLEDRLQSEDRAHRIGQKNNVLYIDLEAKNTIDTTIIRALLSKKDVADVINGDERRQWLRAV